MAELTGERASVDEREIWTVEGEGFCIYAAGIVGFSASGGGPSSVDERGVWAVEGEGSRVFAAGTVGFSATGGGCASISRCFGASGGAHVYQVSGEWFRTQVAAASPEHITMATMMGCGR